MPSPTDCASAPEIFGPVLAVIPADKQSGLGREGGTEGLHPFLETKTVILDGPPERYR